MRELTYYVAVSIDGFIAGPEGEFDFYPTTEAYAASMNAAYPDVVPSHIREQVDLADVPNKHFDTVVMGRGAYDPALKEGFTSPFGHLRQYVFSRSLTESPDPEVTVVATDPLEKVRELKAEEGLRLGIFLCGGGQLAGQLLPEIDKLVIKNYPVVAGSGVPAFATDFNPTQFTLTGCQSFDNGCVVAAYDRA